ncbi:MAG: hypothetical protein AAFX06_03895 [Planctomycetota bacterium]
MVFPTSGPQPAVAPTPAPATSERTATTDEDEKSKMIMWTVMGGAGALFLFVASIIAAFRFVGDGSAERAAGEQAELRKQEERQQKIQDDAAPYVPKIEGDTYQEVTKLAESTRKRIYREHVGMIESSFGKAGKVPRGGAIGQSFRGALGGIIEREINRLLVAYGITREEYANILAEGEDKGW